MAKITLEFDYQLGQTRFHAHGMRAFREACPGHPVNDIVGAFLDVIRDEMGEPSKVICDGVTTHDNAAMN